MSARGAWADHVLDAGWPWPSYRSDDWHGLADDDPRRLAATVAAAECWHEEPEQTRARLRAELEQEARAVAARVRGASYDVAGAAELWAAMRRADLRRRAVRARAGDAA